LRVALPAPAGRAAARSFTVALLLALALGAGDARADEPVTDLYRRSYALEGWGDVAGALAAMDQIGKHGASDYMFSLRRGWLAYLGGKHVEAVAEYQKAIALEPRALEPRLGVMLPLMALRRWKEAEKVGAEILAVAPGDFTAQSRLAYIHYTQDRFVEAEAWYRKALAGFPSNVEMRVGLGWSLLKQGRSKEARVEFERVLGVAPDYASAKEGLAASAPSSALPAPAPAAAP
jgi:tetratricopeptide (TPR) repeat protein